MSTLSAPTLIQKKRDGKALTEAELRFWIDGVLSGQIPDYQTTAFLMAVYFKGMTLEETVAFTRCMLESGDRIDLSSIPGPKADKHSTGGVGDKVSLILAPLAAACGLKVPMMSGRGLGHSGGTLDKLESIPGFNVKLEAPRFKELLQNVGCAMMGQTDRVAPADRRLYALRDVTGTVECLPLITASILSKKIAEGTESLVLDVKTGSGAFMKSLADSKALAKLLVEVARRLGLQARALITDMSQPLGYAVGNALEVKECVELLRNRTPRELASGDLKELTVQLCAEMLNLAGQARSLAEGRKKAHAALASGAAYERFLQMVEAQGGSVAAVENTQKLPKSPVRELLKATKRGYITAMDTEAIGRLVVEMGGGRLRAGDPIDPGVGLVFSKKLGARVTVGEPIATAHLASASKAAEVRERFDSAITIQGARKAVPRLIYCRI